MQRLMIKIDEGKCTGCGLCVPSCAEGALRIIDGKARIVNEVYCDGLGACLGDCPEGALSLEEQEVLPFDEEAVKVHLSGQTGETHGCPSTASRVLHREESRHDHGTKGVGSAENVLPCGCPASSERVLDRPSTGAAAPGPVASQLAHWPVQLELVSPRAPFLRDSDLLVAADCVPFAYAGFHQNLLQGHTLLIGCPKLDDASGYVKKLAMIIAQNKPRSITVAHMEVGCCFGLTQIVQEAIKQSGVNIPMHTVIVSVDGELEKVAN
ncbi:MAG: ATP-binding protein [Bacillota bacterium]